MADEVELVVTPNGVETRDRTGNAVNVVNTVVAGKEPLTYERYQPEGSRTSYFRDRALAYKDAEARERLQRHRREMEIELPRQERRAYDNGGPPLEYRVPPNRTDGQGGFFAPPLWVNQWFAKLARPGRCITRLSPPFDLPDGCVSVNVPRITGGDSATPVTDGSAVPESDVTDAQVESPVVTIAGQSDWPLQALEQSPVGAHLDWAIFSDLTSEAIAQEEIMLVSGSGANGQLTGLLGLSGTNKVTYTTGSPNGETLYPELGKAMAQVGDARKQPPEAVLMRTARYAWIGVQEDSSKRPLDLSSDYQGSFPIGGLVGIGVYLDDAIPANLGAGKNQDVIIYCRPSDFIILESQPNVAVQQDVLSNTLQVRFKLHTRVAALLGRYASGIGIVEGSGLAVQSGF